MNNILILVTTHSLEEAKKIATILIEERLAACCNLIPNLTSIYRWEGDIHDESEALLLIKTTKENEETVIARVKENHEYRIPEIIVMDIQGGFPEYLKWIRDSVI